MAALTAILLAQALAVGNPDWPRTVERPPPQYERPASEIDPNLEVALPYARLQAICGTLLTPLPRGVYYQGCWSALTELAYVPDKTFLSAREREAVRIHENAHRLGWRHTLTPAQTARVLKEQWK